MCEKFPNKRKYPLSQSTYVYELASKMTKKEGVLYDAYYCTSCKHYHIGTSTKTYVNGTRNRNIRVN